MNQMPKAEDVIPFCPGTSEYSVIGQGGFKIVFKAKVAESAKYEAIKVVGIPISPDELNDDGEDPVKKENIQRILREIKILKNCSSPFLVKLGSIEPFEQIINGFQYVIYSEEYIDGCQLRDVIKPTDKPEIIELLSLANCLLSVLKELKRLNVIHRDIKPENIMKSTDPERPFVLLDLGIAYVVGGTSVTRNQNSIIGTRYYIAPEMLESNYRSSLDYRADLYTVGLVLYEYSVGFYPFAHSGENDFMTLTRIKNNTPEPLGGLRTDLPMKFCKNIDQLIKKIPALRPANIDMLMKVFGGSK